jgi:hypothetical protein
MTRGLVMHLHTLIEAGANVSVDASGYLPAALRELAGAVSERGSTLLLRNAGVLGQKDLLAVTKAGKGKVTLEF